MTRGAQSVDFVFGLSPGASMAQGEMMRQALLERFPTCTFLFDHLDAGFMEDWIMPVSGKPHPFDPDRMMMIGHPPEFVCEVIEAFREELRRARDWKPS